MSETKPDADKIESDLDKLLLDFDGVEEIEAGLGGFNIFEAIGQARREERHSDFLASLLDPNGTHGLGAEFLSRFVVEVVKTMERNSRPLTLSNIALMDFGQSHVLREHLRIDVLCIDETNRFLLAIENKIGSREHSNQLRNYRDSLERLYHDYRLVLAYLTPERDEPSDDNWVPIGYEDVLSIVETICSKRGQNLNSTVFMALDQYARTLRRHVVTDSKLVETANVFYRKHKAALDFIFEQKRDNLLEIKEIAVNLADEQSRIKVVRQSKSTINFFPDDWNDVQAFNDAPEDKWTKSGHSLLFEIRNHSSSVRMAVVIGPTAQEGFRQKIHDYCLKNRDIFRGASKSLYAEYTTIYSNTLLTKNFLETKQIDEIKIEYEKKFKSFMESDFGNIVLALFNEFSEV